MRDAPRFCVGGDLVVIGGSELEERTALAGAEVVVAVDPEDLGHAAGPERVHAVCGVPRPIGVVSGENDAGPNVGCGELREESLLHLHPVTEDPIALRLMVDGHPY
jgi:hypothetical protein